MPCDAASANTVPLKVAVLATGTWLTVDARDDVTLACVPTDIGPGTLLYRDTIPPTGG